jgi:TRAP-type mannitol/chloroaromatic compound transport system permease small subunit
LTAGLITLVGFLLPFIAVVMLVAIPVVALIFVLRRRR